MSKKTKTDEQLLANLDGKILEIQSELKAMKPTDDGYAKLSNALADHLKVRNDYLESKAKTAKDRSSVWDVIIKAGYAVGAIGVSVLGLSLAYKVDSSDEIIRNKSTLGIVGKLFPPKRM